MKLTLAGEARRVTVALLALLLLKAMHLAQLPGGIAAAWLDELVTTMSTRGLNKEAREALTAGYYEGLLNEGSRLSMMNHLVTDTRRQGWEPRRSPESRPTNDFLFFEHVPNQTTRDYDDERFRYMLETNSAGLADKEYTLAKPDRTRRIALMGDSITRGLGAPQGGNFEALLEAELNASHTTVDVDHYELLNFAVSGYHITQQMEAAKLKATPYEPDVYVIALSDLSVYRSWHGHISSLMYSGIDLKYPYLRSIIQEARLTPDDPAGAFDARLARYRLPTIKWVLGELKAHAAAHDAELMVILVPTTEDPKSLAEQFLGVHEVATQLGIPVIDLLGTFGGIVDLDRYRVADGDRHPNAAGHELLYKRLYSQLKQNPVALQLLTGSSARLQHDAAH